MNGLINKLNVVALIFILAITVPSSAQTVFSLDIGSDSEISDPAIDVNEGADPGDLYLASQVVGSLIAGVPVLDDSSLFGGVDPAPVTGVAASGVPLGTSGLLTSYFDIDGYDALSARITQLDISPGAPLPQPLLKDNIQLDCVNLGNIVLTSFSDDSIANWGAAMPPRIPVEGLSPLGFLYGTTASQDEVERNELDFSGGYPALLVSNFGVIDEVQLHVDLGPNPTLATVADDDDVDALDKGSLIGCGVHYFSVDTEARMNLNPGAIYQFDGMAAPSLALQNLHFGIPFGTNIDAFEFTWLPIPAGLALAVIYSVQPNDPMTGIDESGGLIPSTVYGSFLTGSSFVVLDGPANGFDNVDALAVPPQQIQDADGDGVADNLDNCLAVANQNQFDADGDGIGNQCDADLSQNCIVDFSDLSLFSQAYLSTDPGADFNVDGAVNFLDFIVMRDSFFGAPGPAAAPNLCMP